MSPTHAQTPLRRLIRRLGRDRDGSVVIEFALLLPPFVLLILAVLEIGLLMLTDIMVQNAAGYAARQLRTGVVQTAPDPEGLFRTLLCDRAEPFLDCDTLTYDVRSYPTFADVAPPAGDPGFSPGGPRAITVVEVRRDYRFFTPLVGAALGAESNTRTLVSTVIVKGEPWD